MVWVAVQLVVTLGLMQLARSLTSIAAFHKPERARSVLGKLKVGTCQMSRHDDYKREDTGDFSHGFCQLQRDSMGDFSESALGCIHELFF